MRFKELMEDIERIRTLQNRLAALPENVSDRLLDKIERALKLAHRSDKKGKTPTVATANTLSKVDDPDLQRGKFYRLVAKNMIGNELTPQEIGSIVRAIRSDKAVNFEELMSPSSDFTKIFPQYGMSPRVDEFFQDIFNYVPQRVGPGEILLCIMSKRITKGGKGDLTISKLDGEEVGVEVKGGKTGGRTKDGDIFKQQASNLRQLQKEFVGRYGAAPKDTGWSPDAIVKLLMNKPGVDPKKVVDDTMAVFNAIFPKSPYAGKIKNAMLAQRSGAGQTQHTTLDNVRALYGMAALELYYRIKPQHYLFIRAGSWPAKTSFVDSFEDVKTGLGKTLGISVSIPYIVDASGNNEEYPKVGIYSL